ncbi:MAG: YgfZ/GcvT domain-containing protein [Acidobacteriota bacterium]
MSQTPQILDAALLETPLATQFMHAGGTPELTVYRGVRTALRFSSTAQELQSLLQTAGIFDRGYRARLRATGKDRVRWLNGMITQAVKSMSPGQVGYTLVLNPQGRIQGDGDVLAWDDHLLLQTDRFQTERLLGHLRRFIIMDDVRLEELDAAATALGIAGPETAAILEKLGGSMPEPDTFRTGQLAGIDVTLVRAWSPVVPRVEIWVAAERVAELWRALAAAGATPCGSEATEQLRILEGTPQFDVDFSDKHLPQEVNLPRALNFTKGCYIGQEIVERIRARATVHRSLRQFELQGEMPAPGPEGKIELRAGETAVGELTSVAQVELPELKKTLALGVARVEALDKSGTEALRYEGGIAVPLDAPPVPAAS